ncbi:ATP-dependent protease La [Hydrogenobacter thermophilus TK-6]|uniref:Lon protease n=1 Tax=Hydrogenobacter thermophilus (strain DSM 6534 / IAM 12695 / TK-6) TaxID=608538 RepID=D3DFN1_HYDTT|nr:endopeptidase La [Hydrogenobacter thermophilus]ADO44577.1 ATP-dependent protease La [Hydrogenobacter thermophilus TK-6]BAI68633.1 ATP-dependent protease La [Hydrogenobacter thermophilus TK-6]
MIGEEFIKVPQIPAGSFELPTMPLRDLVVFPTMVMPLFVGRAFSIRAIEEALKKDRLIFLVLQRERDLEEPSIEDLYRVGTVAHIIRTAPIEEGRLKILVQGLKRAKLIDYKKADGYYASLVEVLEDKEIKPEELSKEDRAYISSLKELLDRAVSLGKQVIPDLLMLIRDIEDPGKLADITASVLDIKSKEAQAVLETLDPRERLRLVHQHALNEVGLLEVQSRIRNIARERMEREQREYFLRQQLKAIQEELGEGDERKAEIEEYREKLSKLKLEKATKSEIEKQINRLEKLHPESAEAGVLRTWLDWVLDLPWNKKTKDRYNLEKARQVLDRDHYDLEKVKDRIIEYLAVRKLTKGKKSAVQILCFVGPPGVGKTSLGKSIAESLGRKFVRISLGGIRDEAEIRGHRRTYVGAMPGRIIQAIKQAGTKNPLIVLDEVDKISISFQGDPAAALLEVLDPEQNKNFVDLYIGMPFDLSDVFFICTANRIDTIPRPLLDRMEVISLAGYSEEEKVFIAKNHLLPKLLPLHGFKDDEVALSDDAILEVIRGYTRESGVRNLQRYLGSVLRKLALKKLKGENPPFMVNAQDIRTYLGVPRRYIEKEEKPMVGIAVGLAWTEVGGEIMLIEATKFKGKGNLLLTGSLGDIMKESAQAALSYIKSKAEDYGIDPDAFSNFDVHIHVPEGAVPKDGPSAGITIATALISLFTERPVRMDIAMTGEVTLRGRVLPVGGLKEKILAAKRAGIYQVILPEKNKDEVLEDLPEYVRDKMTLHFVSNLDEVFDLALLTKQSVL